MERNRRRPPYFVPAGAAEPGSRSAEPLVYTVS
jgi:hypothetical protein